MMLELNLHKKNSIVGKIQKVKLPISVYFGTISSLFSILLLLIWLNIVFGVKVKSSTVWCPFFYSFNSSYFTVTEYIFLVTDF